MRTIEDRRVWEAADPSMNLEEIVRIWNDIWVVLQGTRDGVEVRHIYMECIRQPSCPERAAR